MPHHTSSQSLFLFAALPASTSVGKIDPMIPGGRKHSIGSIHSASSASGGGSLRATSNLSFYNLHRESNRSNIDLHQFPPVHPHQPHPVHQPHHHHHHQLYQHQHLYSTTALNRTSPSLFSSSSSIASSYSGNSIYSSKSAANSTLSLTSSQFSQFSAEPVQHAIGSIPAPRVYSSASAASSSSSLSLNSLNTLSPSGTTGTAPIIIDSVTTIASTVRPVLSSSVSLASFTSPRVKPQSAFSSRHSFPSSYTCSVAELSSSAAASAYITAYHTNSSSRSSFSSSSGSALASSCSLPASNRPLLLPSAAASLYTHQSPLHHLPPRKRNSNTIPPLDTKILATLPSTAETCKSSSCFSSSSAAPTPGSSSSPPVITNSMNSSPPNSAGLSPVEATFSEPSSAGTSPATPKFHSRPFASMAITELVISESQYVAAIKRVANALSQAADNTATTTSRKDSVTLRSLADRWCDIIRIHDKFHDDVVAINEDLREAAGLVNSLLVTLEPILIDHGRDLSAALKKLIRRDQNSEHTFAEWDSALRKPFEQLLVYDEWLQRIDPQSKFSANYRSHISGLTYKVKMVTEVNQNPRNVLRRLSTMAKGVIKRRASVQILSMPVPETPTTPTTPHSYSTTEALVMASNATESPNGIPSTPVSASSSTSSFIPCLPPLPQAVETLAIAENVSPQTASELPSLQSQVFLEEETHEYEVDTSPCADKIPKTVEENVLDTGSIDRVEKPLPLTPEMPAHHSLLSVQPKPQQLQHKYSSESELSSAGTLMTMAAPSSSACSSAASIRSKYSTADTVFTPSRDTSFARQQFLKERDARKATLRVGTHELIQAKAESLQSPTFKSRTPSSADSVRAGMDPRTKDKKPPVKSLISFWEQVSDPLEA